MRQYITAVLSAALACATCAGEAAASDYLTGGIGEYDVIRHKYNSAMFDLEYRFSDWQYGIRPMIGGFINTDGGAYGYAGFDWDVAILPNQLYLIPNFAAGAYSHSNSKNLGGVIEFRSGIEMDYQFQNTQRVGVAFNHLSNASIYNHNPGEENLLVNYSVPFNSLFGR